MRRGILFVLFLFVATLSYADEGATFSLKLLQNRAWLGEPVLARFTLRYPQTMKVDSVQFKPAGLKAFEVEELNVSAPEKKSGEVVQSFRYLLTPTELGTLTIPPQKIELAYQDKTNYRYITHTYRTKPSKITVREVPEALKVVGDYRMRFVSDADRTLANRPVHLQLHITGIGNARYIPPFDLKIPGAIVYPSKPQVMTRWLGEGKYRSEFVQRFTVLADEDYTVPSLRFRYFNLQTELPEVL
ncbi:BatD family protein, partial [Nitratifractor sp.]|uniref:BatD family protein n=1 Tax=Nitratifractor sp. TaxID=2268144 RepID=UPI0025FE1D20